MTYAETLAQLQGSIEKVNTLKTQLNQVFTQFINCPTRKNIQIVLETIQPYYLACQEFKKNHQLLVQNQTPFLSTEESTLVDDPRFTEEPINSGWNPLNNELKEEKKINE